MILMTVCKGMPLLYKIQVNVKFLSLLCDPALISDIKVSVDIFNLDSIGPSRGVQTGYGHMKL